MPETADALTERTSGPTSGRTSLPAAGPDGAGTGTKRGVRFPDHYCWYVLTSTLDVLVTFIIIEVYRGGEANRVASHIFDRFGWPGMIALKYATVLVVIGVCEVVARKNESLARNLAVLAVAVGAFPVLYGFMLVRVWMG